MSSEARTTEGLRSQVVRGGLLLTSQRVLSAVIAGIGGIVLARVLMPELFGVYGIISFVVGLGVVLGDLGIGAAFLQRRDLNLQTSLSAAFTAQFGLALLLGGVIAISAPFWIRWVGLEPSAIAPLQCLSILVPLAALRMPVAVMLERELRYGPVTLAETLDTLVFHSVAVVAALIGWGVWSFVAGVVSARLAGFLVLWRSSRWQPSVGWQWSDLRPTLTFGLPFQGTAMLTLVRDAIVPTAVVAWAGVAAVGYLTWAAALAYLPLQLVSIAGRVLLPALSRLQTEPRAFAIALERALNRVAVVLYPAAFLLLAGAEPIVRFVYGPSWVPAVPAVQLFCVTAILGGTSNMLVHAFYCLGRADVVFRLNILWTVLLWGLALPLVWWLGFVGFALASACLSLTSVVTALMLKKLVPVRIIPAIRAPLIAGMLAGLCLGVLTMAWVDGVVSLLISAAAATGVYVLAVGIIGGMTWCSDLMEDWRDVLAWR
jgi:teichuronic acid exporter